MIHAVGPNYWDLEEAVSNRDDQEEDEQDPIQIGNKLLQSAYAKSLELAKEHNLEAVAFSLLSAGVFRGSVPLEVVLGLSIDAIDQWARVNHDYPIEVTLCAFSIKECETLQQVCEERLKEAN